MTDSNNSSMLSSNPVWSFSLIHVFTLLYLVTSNLMGQMIVADYTTETNDRFENDGAFFAGAYDFSGVGRAATGHWATLVSSQVFVSAGHHHPAVGATITFHHNNDPFGATTIRTVSGGSTISGGDAWVGWLNAPVGPGVTYYGIPNLPAANLATFAATPIANNAIFTVGKSSSGNKGAVSNTNFVVGQNIVDGFGAGVVGGGISNDVIQWVQDEPGDADKLLYESRLNTGDSGGPSFYANGSGGLDLVGVHFTTHSIVEKAGKYRGASRDTYLPNYLTAIESQINSHTVPEPSSGAMLAISCLLCALRRIRQCDSVR